MIVELKKGYTIESKYDKFSDSYITRLLDNESKQVGDALSSKDIVGKNQDIKSVKDYFTNYINNKRVEDEIVDDLDFIEPEEEVEEEAQSIGDIVEGEDLFEESLSEDTIKKKARKTKKATRKAQLPALSTLSPIIPDTAKGISNFNAMQADGNSGLGSTTGSTSLGEEYKDRNTLIDELKGMGFKYKFDKYSDKQLYRIYQERLKALKKREEVRKAKQQAYQEQENKRANAKDSYFRDGIEFESEDAAREYFGESMDNKFYLNDMHKAWNMIDPEDEVSIPITHSKLSESLTEGRKPKYVDSQFGAKVFHDMKSGKLTFDNIKEWDKEQNGGIEPNPPFNTKELMLFYRMRPDYFEESLNESYRFDTITEGLKFFENKHFDEACEDIQLESLFESMRDKLSSDDVKKLGAFMNHAQDADEVLTYMKGLLSEDVKTETFSISDLTSQAEKLLSTASNEGVWNTDIYDIDILGTTAIISILVKGDWKHDHARFDLIAREFFPDAEMYEYDLDEDDEYESDYYPSIHVIELHTKNEDKAPLELNLMNEAIETDAESTGQVIVSKFVDECKARNLKVNVVKAGLNTEGHFEVDGAIAKGQEMNPDEILDVLIDLFKQYGYDDIDSYNDWRGDEMTFKMSVSERDA